MSDSLSSEKLWRKSCVSSLCEPLADTKNHWMLSAVTSGNAFEMVKRNVIFLACTAMTVLPSTAVTTGIAAEGGKSMTQVSTLQVKQNNKLTLYGESCKTGVCREYTSN